MPPVGGHIGLTISYSIFGRDGAIDDVLPLCMPFDPGHRDRPWIALRDDLVDDGPKVPVSHEGPRSAVFVALQDAVDLANNASIV